MTAKDKKVIKEKVDDLSLRISDFIPGQCHILDIPLPEKFEDEFFVELEELLEKFYGYPDYGNYN